MYFDCEQPKPVSKKIQCPPGGKDNVHFFYNDAAPEKCNFKKQPDTHAQYNIITLQSNENNQFVGNAPTQKVQSIKTNYQKQSIDIFNGVLPEEKPQSSIKVTHPIGGRSKVCYANNQ